MDSSASRVRSGTVNRDVHSNDPLSKLTTYRFALAIIVGIGGLVVGGAGLAGYFQVGALSNLSQVHAIIMMTAGGGGGTILLVVGIVGSVKNHQKGSYQHYGRDIEYNDRTRQPNQTSNAEIIQSIDTQGGLVYGPAAWRVWNVEVLNYIPETPVIDWDENDPFFHEAYRENYALLYIPGEIRVNGEEEKYLTLQTIKEISGNSFNCVNKILEEFGDNVAPGWVLVSKKVIPDSRNKNYETQKNMVEEKQGFRMPHVFEAVVLNLMIFALTGERLYGAAPRTYTSCIENVNGDFDNYHPIVGSFYVSLNCFFSRCSGDNFCGVAALQKF